MASEPIISVSGLRGILGESLRPDVVVRYTAAFAARTADGPMVLTRDGRAGGSLIADLVSATLRAAGRTVLSADVAATPTTGVLVRTCDAAGGIQVSASHNPPEYNGLKLFGRDGRVLSEAAGEAVLTAYHRNEFPGADYRHLGSAQVVPNPTHEHCRLILAAVDVERIRSQSYSVLLDSNHGAGGELAQQLLERLGCRVTVLGGQADGEFEHPPEPTAENLEDVGHRVVAAGAAVGFCQDPDADRLALIDEHGRYVGEEYTLALCVWHVLSQRAGPIVTNCATSRMCEDLARRHEVPFYRAKVGEANVADLMVATQAVFGGEGNGGPIDPRVGYVRDSFVGMALVLDAMARDNVPLSQLVHQLPRYAMFKTKLTFPSAGIPEALGRLERHFGDARPDRLDGLRLDWPHQWLLIRPSNTEPVVRLIAEARTPDDARSLCRQAGTILDAVQAPPQSA